jgi:HSP20 family protein
MGNLTEFRPFRSTWPSIELFNDFFRNALVGEPSAARFAPAMEVTETPESYVLRAELPGIDPKDVQITLTGDTLTIQGEKKSETRTDKEHTHIVERTFGAFSRSFTFPASVESESVEAESDQGVLTIRVHKARESRPRKISVKAK